MAVQGIFSRALNDCAAINRNRVIGSQRKKALEARTLVRVAFWAAAGPLNRPLKLPPSSLAVKA